jgi:alpha-L-rhamnosidase
MNPVRLTTSRLTTPIGLDTDPVFGWTVEDERRGVRLRRARVEVWDERSGEARWDSGDRETPGVPQLSYAGPRLEPGTRYGWRVRVEDADGRVSPWSETTWFETGLRGAGLDARWICLDERLPLDRGAPVQYLRRDFDVPGEVVRARAYSTALGWYRLHLNGVDVTGPGLVPRFTAFEQRVEYQAHDVTAHIRSGANAIGLVIADGRFRGRNSGLARRGMYGDQARGIARLEVELASGEVVVIRSDASWEGGHGEIRAADPQDGEVIDARHRSDWSSPGGRLVESVSVIEVEEERSLVGVACEPVRAVEELVPVAVVTSPTGATIVDFGQNVVGVTRLELSGPAGTTVVVRHSEVLTPGGEIDTSYARIRGSEQDELTLSGGERDVFEPAFTIQGFRYAEVTGLPAPLDPRAVRAVVLASAFEYHGRFTCSDTRLERLHDNIVLSMRGNFTDIPTDCPTRERSGWTGDAQIFAPTALLLGDASAFLRNWLVDLGLQQRPDGCVLDTVPVDFAGWYDSAEWVEEGFLAMEPGSGGWGDAAVLVPWAIYRATGSTAVLEDAYDSMVRWVEFSADRATRRHERRVGTPASPHERYLIETGWHFGEWLEPRKSDGTEGSNVMLDLVSNPPSEVATAYFAHSSRVLAHIATLLGQDADAERFETYADGATEAWRLEFVDFDGRLRLDTQANHVRALAFDLVTAEDRPAIAARLVELVRAAGNHLDTGFLSTGLLLPVLSRAGYGEVALDLLLQTTAPSWLYAVERGATTVWETWEGYDDDGQAKASHNHYSFGAVARWMYEELAGLRATSPGWSTIEVTPFPSERIEAASAATSTPFGPVSVDWRIDAVGARLAVAVPVGATATVHLPGAVAESTRESGRPVVEVGVETESDARGLVVRLGSGSYEFDWSYAVSGN